MSSTYNILMYSHDTYGLGHIRRTMAIARNLSAPGVNILILTGSPIAGRFPIPFGVDFVRIPGMIKQSNTVYVPHSIKVDPQKALEIRQEIITATAKSFDPDLFIVDKVPVGLKGEVLPVLQWFKTSRPDTKVVLGLRDILDDSASTRAEWNEKNYFNVLDSLYSEIWIYGQENFYNPIVEYGLPPSISNKCVFTGYIPRQTPNRKITLKQLMNGNGNGTADSSKLIVVTAGGGGDGYHMLDTYLTMIEETPDIPFKTYMVSGPFVPQDLQDSLAKRAKKCGVIFATFHKRLEKIMAAADLVVSMGGYNTICEILSLKKPSLIIPRESPRLEQLIRARVLQSAKLADYIKWDCLTPLALREKLVTMLEDSSQYEQSINEFSMTGLEIIRSRLSAFKGDTIDA
ncbi:glycosyltransferase family protein [Halodesulfovibrio sp. MK-HDV]|jgi:predicted glycosyltransferase|uniref:glycosyltransferase family protein n=1 Tax=unclassified Halodesulfovibrio TaxID=2644657 RepID=UPI00136EB4A3|nr:glycosyltransferase [Halodesulfovibrio sp. MK-HDV]KAF1075325.1 UDP-N-acetylglucosamine--N-acetylmuramyl-(pentapeptide) pyrophosphoryl-undecaprenol N-acetylglucosamine transferase [Halodesulfovibrio sp. MK-HDV]